MEEYLLEMKNIHKRFPGVYALKGVDLTLKAGEVMALVGENGAGKSTIINILGGIYTRDEGEILIDGKDAGIHGIQDAKAANQYHSSGIGACAVSVCGGKYFPESGASEGRNGRLWKNVRDGTEVY